MAGVDSINNTLRFIAWLALEHPLNIPSIIMMGALIYG